MHNDKHGNRLRRVNDIVTTILAKHDPARAFGLDDDLGRLGLTSIDMVELMLAVEGEFDLVIPPSEITTENFRSVAAVDRLVARLVAQSGGLDVEAA